MTAPTTRPTVLTEDLHGVRRITLARPPVNALSAEEYAVLKEAFTVGSAGGAAVRPVRVVLLSGQGATFCAGQDLTELRGLSGPDTAAYLRQAASAIAAAARCPVPVVAALHGPATGAGALLVAVSDHVVAAEEAWLAFPEARLGLELGASLLGFLPPAVAWTALATGSRLDARRLHSLGAVADLVPTGSSASVAQIAERRVGELMELSEHTRRWLRDAGDPEDRAQAYEAEVRALVDRLEEET